MIDAIAFYPSAPERAQTLAGSDVAHFNEHGFVRPLDVLTGAEVENARGYFESLLARVRALKDGRRAYTLAGYHNPLRHLGDARHPLISTTVEDLLGPDSCAVEPLFRQLPGDPKTRPVASGCDLLAVRPTKTVTVWLAIDDVDEGNAPMQFLPGSHRLGEITWEPAKGDTVLHQEVQGVDRSGTPVHNTLRAGQVSIHTSTLLHGSDANTSARRRCGLALRYIPSSCGAVEHPSALKRRGLKPGTLRRAVLRNAVVCRGDPGLWQRNAPPSGDDVTMIHRHYRN